MKYVKDFVEGFDYSSYEKMYKLIEKHFNYDEASLEKIHDAMFNQKLDDFYYDFFKNNNGGNDLRVRFSIDKANPEAFEYFDSSYKIFKLTFMGFNDKYFISYKEYFEGKVSIDKNKVKLFKAIKNYYLSRIEIVDGHKFKFQSDVGNTFNFNTIVDNRNYPILIFDYSYFSDKFDLIGKSEQEVKKIIFQSIEEHLKSVFDNIYSRKINNKNKQLVVSFNYADWFSASTGNSWTSCINLDSNYAACFWAGLPTTFLDENRSIIYVSDINDEEVEYHGVKFSKKIERSWMLLLEDDLFYIQKGYPSNTIINIVRSIFKNTCYEKKFFQYGDSEVGDAFSKNKVRILTNNNGTTQNIYYDNLGVEFFSHEKDNFFINYFTSSENQYYGYNFNKEEVMDETPYDFSGGLRELISRGDSLGNHTYNDENENYVGTCHYTDEEIYEDDGFNYDGDGNLVIRWYFEENFSSCSVCHNYYHNDEMTFTEDGHQVCESHIDRLYYSEYTEEYYFDEKNVVYIYNSNEWVSRDAMNDFLSENADHFYDEDIDEIFLTEVYEEYSSGGNITLYELEKKGIEFVIYEDQVFYEGEFEVINGKKYSILELEEIRNDGQLKLAM